MAQPPARFIGWILLGDLYAILAVLGFGLLLRAMEIPMEGHPVLGVLLGEHDLLFNLGLGALLVALILLFIAWIIALIVGFLGD